MDDLQVEKPLVSPRIDGQIGTIVIDNPEKRNALSHGLIEALIATLEAFAAEGVRAVILRARPGVKVWSSGHDVYDLPSGGRDPLGWDDPLRELVRAIEECPAPVIAMIEGGVWGGACEVVFACDLIIAAPSATFAVTPAKLGVPYNVSGMLTFMNACPMRIVKEMVFTAKPISAQRAEGLGIINHMVPSRDLEAFTQTVAESIALNAPLSISVMKEQLRMLAGAHPMSPRRFERVQGLRRIVWESEDYEEGLRAFKQKRKPRFSGR
ncbi:MAG: methylmalonyl-CoA decarboxylase [Hyphomicrobium sp. 32-62-53]|nr:MAG: methylmalonyl-CoA decarboxylase [Hyphomicrobium sp. 12-62-95]OYX99182.1 MAG: methylmalonyl-CoA decarboxylase [Hyphomicrobium sp. 32-62-53]